MRELRLSLIALAMVVSGSAKISQGQVAQSKGDDFASTFHLARQELLQGNYLTAVDLVRPFALTESPDKPPQIRDPYPFQVWNQMQAMVSGEPSQLKPGTFSPSDQVPVAAIADATSRDALSAIIENARSTRVVILNENHTTPCQRAFGAQVAEALRPLGYNILALEALATVPVNTASEMRKRGYPVYGDGFYTRDPVFAAFIRRSLKIGFDPLAYEYYPQQGGAPQDTMSREQGQAANIARFLKDNPKSKLIIYSGGSHLAEQPLADGSKMMGQWLQELSGVNPLTIDQNSLQPGTAARRYLINRPVTSDRILFFKNQPLVIGSLAGKVDMQVLPREPLYVDGRPNCILGADRTRKRITLRNVSTSRSMLLQIKGANDDPAAVPLDQVVVRPGISKVIVFLPKKKIRYIWRN